MTFQEFIEKTIEDDWAGDIGMWSEYFLKMQLKFILLIERLVRM